MSSSPSFHHDSDSLRYSIVIPVYNSESIVGEMVNRTVTACASNALDYEIILVNDGSTDSSAEVIEACAKNNPRIRVFHLTRNRGQHSAIFFGFRKTTGDYVITMDDDLQNPPQEIHTLIEKAAQGHDLVFGRFRSKQHPRYRRAASHLVNWLNQHLFGKPDDLVVSNFRILSRAVVERVLACHSPSPYITGLALVASRNPANVTVAHHLRTSGSSRYSARKLLALASRLLFNHSTRPLRVATAMGWIASAVHLVIGVGLLPVVLARDSLMLFLASAFSVSLGILFAMLSILAIYLTHLLQICGFGCDTPQTDPAERNIAFPERE